jgi:hypothetical protein
MLAVGFSYCLSALIVATEPCRCRRAASGG